jgi:hypothetical protein
MPREYKMYINGEWVDALDRAMYDDYDPYTRSLPGSLLESAATQGARLRQQQLRFPRGQIRSPLSARRCS